MELSGPNSPPESDFVAPKPDRGWITAKPEITEQLKYGVFHDSLGRVMWLWSKRYPKEGFPADFAVQRIGIAEALAISDRPPREIAEHFRKDLFLADRLLSESYDKRYGPSTFITEEGGEYRVGWYSKGYQCERRFTDLADAATDYLLFSLGKGRWSPFG